MILLAREYKSQVIVRNTALREFIKSEKKYVNGLGVLLQVSYSPKVDEVH